MKRAHHFPSAVVPRGFTLIELLVVIAIIAVLGGLTALGYRGVANDAKLSSGKNAVMAALDTARGLAMKNNRPTVVAFRSRLLSRGDSRVEVVIADWNRERSFPTNNSNPIIIDLGPGTLAIPRAFDRFVPVPGIEPRLLPKGISVAGPDYSIYAAADTTDSHWTAPTNVAKTGEAPGRIIGVLYGPDGRTHTANPFTNLTLTQPGFRSFYFGFIDIDGDKEMDRPNAGTNFTSFQLQQTADDESFVQLVPFLCVFDEKEARDVLGDSDWNIPSTRDAELTQHIIQNADAIHFNRYSGVVMK